MRCQVLAATILDGLPGVDGGRRYQGRRYRGGRLVPARLGADVAHLTLPDGSRVTTASAPLRAFAKRRLARVKLRGPERPREHSRGHARLQWADGATREGWLRVGEAQARTGAMAAEVVRRLLAGQGRPGAYTPAALFGPSLAQACGGEYLIDDEAGHAAPERR